MADTAEKDRDEEKPDETPEEEWAESRPEDEQPPERKAPSFWASFTVADMRTLVVTIAGTVIGGILLAMLVGFGVILARKWSGNPGGLGEAAGIGTSVVAGWWISLPIAVSLASSFWSAAT